MTKAKISPFLATLAIIMLALSSWGLFRLAVDFAHTPTGLAALAVAGFDLFAIACEKHALDLADDGDSPAPWYALLFVVACLAAVMQFGHAILAGWPALLGVMFAVFPLAT